MVTYIATSDKKAVFSFRFKWLRSIESWVSGEKSVQGFRMWRSCAFVAGGRLGSIEVLELAFKTSTFCDAEWWQLGTAGQKERTLWRWWYDSNYSLQSITVRWFSSCWLVLHKLTLLNYVSNFAGDHYWFSGVYLCFVKYCLRVFLA